MTHTKNLLLIWKEIFGKDALPNDGEIVGLDTDGRTVIYDAQRGTCFNNGYTPEDSRDTFEMNEREHIVCFPTAYVALLRMHLKECFTDEMNLKVGSIAKLRDGIERQKTRLKEINDIVERATKADPHKYVSDLAKEGQYAKAKKEVEAEPATPEQTMLQNEPMLAGKNGKVKSLAAFAKECHVLASNKYISVSRGFSLPGAVLMQRKFVVLFGRNEETGTWKYYARIYRRTKREALEAAMELVQDHAMGRKSSLLVQGTSEDFFLEAFVVNYDRRVPIVF